MAAEDETPRGALACLHTGGAGTSCGRGAKGLSARGSGQGGRARRPGKASRRHIDYLPRHNSINPQTKGCPPADRESLRESNPPPRPVRQTSGGGQNRTKTSKHRGRGGWAFDCARSVWARQAAVQCAGVQACGATSMRRRQASRRRHRRKTRILEDEAKPRNAARNLQNTGCNGNPKRLPVHNGR